MISYWASDKGSPCDRRSCRPVFRFALVCRMSRMSWSRGDPGAGRRGYHHGNLREALIRAALDLIAEKGPAGFTFADAARSAGVSSAAPYRHFRDRQALLADVARRGFELFEERLTAPGTRAGPTRFAPSRMSGEPISPLPAKSRLSTRRCSRRACRSTAIRICSRRRTGPSRCCARPPTPSAPGCRPSAGRRH